MQRRYRFALFGHPVKHSLSPVMHAASFQSIGLDAEYLTFDVPPDELKMRLAAVRNEGFDGVNLTIPHKEASVPFMDRLDASARVFGAVNTVKVEKDGLVGCNTDAEGFLRDLKESRDLSPDGLRVLVLGCGGAGRALAIACVREGAAEVGLANRTEGRVAALAEDIADHLPDATAQIDVLSGDPEAWARYSRESDLVLQCTSAGLHFGDAPLLPCAAFRTGQLVYDLVYTQRVTPTMRAALDAGADAMNGAGMLVHQGAAAFAVWTGMKADTAAMRAALEARLYQA